MQSALGGWIKYTITAAIRKSQQYLYILIFRQKHCVFMVFFAARSLLLHRKTPLWRGFLRIITFAPETGRLHVGFAPGSSLSRQKHGVFMWAFSKIRSVPECSAALRISTFLGGVSETAAHEKRG
jgi:hypothetical protein